MAGEREVNGGGENEGGIEKTNTSDGSLYFPRVVDMSTLGMNRSFGRQEINFDLDHCL